MSDQATLDAIQTAELIEMVDATRPADDPFKLARALHDLLQTRLAEARTKNAASLIIGATTLGAAAQRQQALDRLAELLRNGYNAIGAVPSDDLPEALRALAYAAYGWDGGKIGDLGSPARILKLAGLAATATADAGVPAAGKYPASLVARIASWVGVFEGASLLATGGSRQTLNQQRNEARDGLTTANSRVRHAYCAASDDTEGTPELARIAMQPKRASGEAQPQPQPGLPGIASFNAMTRELAIPALPEHATYLRAFRQATGGKAESAGVSNTATVSVVGLTPLTPGAAYTFWVAGENSRGTGPESNRVTFTA